MSDTWQVEALNGKLSEAAVGADKLRRELAERDGVIAENYQTLQGLRRRVQELETHKFVLSYKVWLTRVILLYVALHAVPLPFCVYPHNSQEPGAEFTLVPAEQLSLTTIANGLSNPKQCITKFCMLGHTCLFEICW
eukprot:GHUV01048855.1.p1 GENE.GHUV01048855.1~~GHUV01048855.1.p1  ORF type:complete len:137 (+),score=34.96 GHUV01048855.1:254-664(+)